MQLESNYPLKRLCTFGVGGVAKYFAVALNATEMQNTLKHCLENDLHFVIIGKGSNVLFDDRGFNGVVIHNKIDFCLEPTPGTFYVGAGMSFSRLGTYTAKKGWSGLEFASGIPGSVGGAVFMNAGSGGSETADTLVSCEYINFDGTLTSHSRDELHFDYRHSPYQQKKGAIISATFRLSSSPTAKQDQRELITYRTKTQPLSAKSAGCIFRNPTGGSAGQLIEQCNLKGERIGDAQVSDIHSNFIVNLGNAKATEITTLVAHVKSTVKSQTGVDLKEEVRYIPYE
ncbi:MAG: UDP-N-acetylmuramate dehydrogenase [Waddliaceae bacterium]